MSNWRKSTYSNNSGGACVEVATADAVLIRDTTDHGHGPLLRVSAETWRAFTQASARTLPSADRTAPEP